MIIKCLKCVEFSVLSFRVLSFLCWVFCIEFSCVEFSCVEFSCVEFSGNPINMLKSSATLPSYKCFISVQNTWHALRIYRFSHSGQCLKFGFAVFQNLNKWIAALCIVQRQHASGDYMKYIVGWFWIKLLLNACLVDFFRVPHGCLKSEVLVAFLAFLPVQFEQTVTHSGSVVQIKPEHYPTFHRSPAIAACLQHTLWYLTLSP